MLGSLAVCRVERGLNPLIGRILANLPGLGYPWQRATGITVRTKGSRGKVQRTVWLGTLEHFFRE